VRRLQSLWPVLPKDLEDRVFLHPCLHVP
jgi:hypothetical protein